MLAGDAGPGFRRAPIDTKEALALAHIAAPDARLWNRQPLVLETGPELPRGFWDTLRGSDLVARKFLQFAALASLLMTASTACVAQDVAQSSLPLASSDVSLVALFLQAHWVVKTVMLGLLSCSVWVWAIAIDKIILYSRTKRAMDRFEQAFWSGQSIEELYRALSAKPTQSMAACFVAAMREWKRSFESQTRSFAGLQMRIEKVMNVSIAREVERLERRLLVLATVGSAGPFVGLFGTVWGIMSSFQSIAASKNTSLAVVAPGIAEALFATAIGLIAAIPATIFYNKFTSEVNRQAQRLEGFADEFSAILSRQIDERA
jgi:biopolymer transport protein TolQ